MLYRVLLAISLLSVGPLCAQRIIAQVEPAEEDELRFDVNESPLTNLGASTTGDLNFSPNVVFSPDSSRAFVSFPGSNRVVVFDPATGEILNQLEVGPNPSVITLSPDGRTLALPTLHLLENIPRPDGTPGNRLGDIVLIDIETLAIRKISFNDVLFSFANNVVFSGDGKTGFIASSGTDQVLRFNVETATEITPRFAMPGGSRPSAATMAPDSSFFAVVLVGSSAVDVTQQPDSVQLISTSNFSLIRELVPPPFEFTGTGGITIEIPHNFFSYNNMAISLDGKTGIIADQENAVFSILPELANDHALIFDLETGSVENTVNIGGLATSTTRMPDRDVFAIVTSVDVSVINLETGTIARGGTGASRFRPTNRPVFTLDRRQLIVGSPVIDRILVTDLRTSSLRNTVATGLDFESENINIPAGTLDVALSPDGRYLTALNFNANTIAILKSTVRYTVPELLRTNEWFSGTAILNPTDGPAEIIAAGVARNGIPFGDDPMTEDVVEYVNPKLIELEPGEQTSFTAAGLLEPAEGLTPQGWLDLDSDVDKLAAFYLTGDTAVTRMDGAMAAATFAITAILPNLRLDEGFITEISATNNNLSLATVVYTLIDNEGEVADQVSLAAPPSAQVTRFLIPPSLEATDQSLFPPGVIEEGKQYFLVVASTAGVIVHQRYYDAERMGVMSGITAAGDEAIAATTLYAPQVATFGGTRTVLSLVANTEEAETVTVTFIAESGEQIGQFTRELQSLEIFKGEIAELFELTDPGEPIEGWILVEADAPGIVGSTEIEVFNGKALSLIPLLTTPAPKLAFAHVAQDLGFATGLSLLNPGDQPALAKVTVHLQSGEVVGQAEISLAARGRVAVTLDEIFEDLPQLTTGYLLVDSDQPLFGLELFFSLVQDLLASVPAHNLASPE